MKFKNISGSDRRDMTLELRGEIPRGTVIKAGAVFEVKDPENIEGCKAVGVYQMVEEPAVKAKKGGK